MNEVLSLEFPEDVVGPLVTSTEERKICSTLKFSPNLNVQSAPANSVRADPPEHHHRINNGTVKYERHQLANKKQKNRCLDHLPKSMGATIWKMLDLL